MDLAGGGTQITGFGPNVTITNADAFDKAHLNMLDGIDGITVMQTGTTGSIRRLEVDGGSEQDTINVQRTAADGAVVVVPSAGNDAINANASNLGSANIIFEASAKLSGVNVGSGGKIRILPGGDKVLSATTLAISPNGTLDLADNAFILDYAGGTNPFPQLQTQIISGYNNGGWNGATGVISSIAATQPNFDIGYAEASAIFNAFPATFVGQSVDNTAVLLRYTYVGDANLDYHVNSFDFNALAQQFNSQSNARWSQGDFTYNAKVNALDFNALATNYGQLPPALSPIVSMFSEQPVTEPGLLDLL
jgi:hypothetical protein